MSTTAAISSFLFYLLATLAVFFSVFVVAPRRILRAAVHLMSVLVMTAGLFLLLKAEFLAGVQILVYVGGIVVLLVFAIMLTSSNEMVEESPGLFRKGLGLLAATGFFVTSVLSFQDISASAGFIGNAGNHFSSPSSNNAAQLGRALLNNGNQGYVLPFEIISLLLLAVILGGIVIARRTPEHESTPTKEEKHV